MKQTGHGAHLIQLTKWTAFNCYFVCEADGLTLVDTLMANDGPAIVAAATALGQPLKRVVMTHTHVDHAGALDEIVAAVPDVELLLTGRSQQFLQGNVTLEAGEPDAKIKGSFLERNARATRTIQPGDMIGSLRMVAAPGHTPDHNAFLDTRDGTLIAGDAFQTKGGIAVAGQMKPLFPFPAFATWHKPTAVRTAHALLDLQPSRLAVGHGAVIEDPAAAMKAAIAARRQLTQPDGSTPTRRVGGNPSPIVHTNPTWDTI